MRDVREGLTELGIQFPEEYWSHASAEVRRLYQKQIEILYSVHDRSRWLREKWYGGPRPGDCHWPSLRDYLRSAKSWREEDIEALDRSSTEVVSLLGNPGQSRFDVRGLVVGHVQSGKTANLTAVIAKAADAGYNFIIVLAGLTNALRYQTQERLHSDLVERHPHLWEIFSPRELWADFSWHRPDGLPMPGDTTRLLVVKKNRAPLGHLKRLIRNTLPIVREKTKVLVIDDECDQASVNAAGGAGDITAINRRIREILALLPAVSYVGYTATPFANVLINPYVEEGQLDDLYPRDFITSLPAPPHYFGAARLFGMPPADPANPTPEEEGLDMIRNIPDEDENRLQPAHRGNRDGFSPAMPESLENALLYFLAACAARRIRGQQNAHMTMLVHTSPYIVLHEKVARLISSWLENHRDALSRPDSELAGRLAGLWESEQNRVPPESVGADRISPSRIRGEIARVLDQVEVVVENSRSLERIDYSGQPRTYIVVGGTVLSRGLTLEGLTVSYFLRSANQYDTLLQMGRWFGYRPGYEDLPRIWTSEELKLKFRALAGIEDEIRAEIDQYKKQQLTPKDLAVRIRTLPGMAVTAPNKMRAAQVVSISFWGTHRQTFRFQHRDADVLDANWQTAAELVNRCEKKQLRDPGSRNRLWRDVPLEVVLDFLTGFLPHPTHADLSAEVLAKFVEETDDRRLEFWNVVLVEPEQGAPSERELGVLGRVRTVRRSRLAGDETMADIKALMSRRDLLLDCPEDTRQPGQPASDEDWESLKQFRRKVVGDKPLLLLYAIDRNSRPERPCHTRAPLDAVRDVLGYGIVFPGSVTEGGKYVSVRLRPLLIEDLEAAEEEEMELAREAGLE
ncbi:MAG: Z1 domain-containing protein [Phycisphaerales bacterium]|nr:Z1 domain-containing protein [Phycisphaerales bacterium]